MATMGFAKHPIAGYSYVDVPVWGLGRRRSPAQTSDNSRVAAHDATPHWTRIPTQLQHRPNVSVTETKFVMDAGDDALSVTVAVLKRRLQAAQKRKCIRWRLYGYDVDHSRDLSKPL